MKPRIDAQIQRELRALQLYRYALGGSVAGIWIGGMFFVFSRMSCA